MCTSFKNNQPRFYIFESCPVNIASKEACRNDTVRPSVNVTLRCSLNKSHMHRVSGRGGELYTRPGALGSGPRSLRSGPMSLFQTSPNMYPLNMSHIHGEF